MKRRKTQTRPMTDAQADKEVADFMQYAHEKGWSFKRWDEAGALIFGNAAGEEKPHHPLLVEYALAVERGYKPVNQEFLRLAADGISAKLPDGWGFILIAAPLGLTGAVTYTASVERADAIRLLKELMFHWGEEENWMSRAEKSAAAARKGVES